MDYPFVIPCGTEIFISPWAINRSPDLWGPDSEEFKPERWIDIDEVTGEERPNNSGGADSNYCQLTFLHGPRSCIGQNFAKAELRCLVAAFINVFGWSLDTPVEEVMPAGVITIKPKTGLQLKLKKVGAW
jgi:cytochrome P450